MKKNLSIGLLAGLLMMIAGMLNGMMFQLLFPSIKIEYQNEQLFRPWTDPLMSLMFVQPFIVGIILAWIWSNTKALFTATVWWKKGMGFGLVYILVSIPGMIMSYSSFPVSCLLILSWTTSIVIEALLAGLLFSRMLR